MYICINVLRRILLTRYLTEQRSINYFPSRRFPRLQSIMYRHTANCHAVNRIWIKSQHLTSKITIRCSSQNSLFLFSYNMKCAHRSSSILYVYRFQSTIIIESMQGSAVPTYVVYIMSWDLGKKMIFLSITVNNIFQIHLHIHVYIYIIYW